MRPQIIETTALGAAYLAGLAVNYWSGIDEIKQQWKQDQRFNRTEDQDKINAHKKGWQRAVNASIAWADSE